jgi:hypothetical protein
VAAQDEATWRLSVGSGTGSLGGRLDAVRLWETWFSRAGASLTGSRGFVPEGRAPS